jgi:hypothetical protein
MYVSKQALKMALDKLQGSASHMIKIWFVLKRMGLTNAIPVSITTSSPNEALSRLFAFGDPDGRLFVPFSHTKRFLTMDSEAGRSIVQTTSKQWAEKNSVGTDPSAFLQVERTKEREAIIRTTRRYPQGLGYGKKGFALEDDARVVITDVAFALWYYRQEDLPDPFSAEALLERLQGDLHLEQAEMNAVFVPDRDWTPVLQSKPLTDEELYKLVSEWMDGSATNAKILKESQQQHSLRIQSAMSFPKGPLWLRANPAEDLQKLIRAGSKAILLFGPPRTGKTRAVDAVIPRTDKDRVTIQIHDGWGYDELMVSFRPNEKNEWAWVPGELLQAIRAGKKYVVLEEINRTQASQALGEVFSLLEEKYRGKESAIILRSGEPFFIPADVVIIATMNNLDKSIEELDDALLGRFAGVEYPPRVEDLTDLLKGNRIPEDTIIKLSELFAAVQQYYSLGHGYFAELKPGGNIIDYYRARIRPVLQSHLKGYRDQDLDNIDEKVDQLFFA